MAIYIKLLGKVRTLLEWADTEDMYFGLGFSHRFTSPILLYIVGKMTGIDSSCSDIHRTPKG